MPRIEFKNITKRFGPITALNDFNLAVEKGESICLFGPSGCGKTTALRLVAGLERPDAGLVILDGEEATSATHLLPPGKRDVGMVFQDLALWPHMRVQRQVEFVLTGKTMSKTDRRQRTDAVLDLCRIAERQQALPAELSGGQQQRVAIARALAPAPSILLLDEPFSSLDAALRDHFIEVLRGLCKEGLTLIFATHNTVEADALADRIVPME